MISGHDYVYFSDPMPLPRSPARPSPGRPMLRFMLGHRLLLLRERAGVGRGGAAAAVGASPRWIRRVESGAVAARAREVAVLLDAYGLCDDGERAAVMAQARIVDPSGENVAVAAPSTRGDEPGWWHEYRDLLPSWFKTYLHGEQAAALIRTYQPQLVPGLLQTEAMARAVARASAIRTSDEDVERRVELRLRRQRILLARGGPRFSAVVDEAALRRITGGPVVMAQQIEHLYAIAQQPNVTLQLVPLGADGHPGTGSAFTVLRFAPTDDTPDVVYLEQLTSALYLDRRVDVDDYLATMDLLCGEALTPRATLRLLEQLREVVLSAADRPAHGVRSIDRADVAGLVARSSLGAPGPRALIQRATAAEVDDILRRAHDPATQPPD